MRVLIIRPEREATALATALAERGHTPVIAPLFRLRVAASAGGVLRGAGGLPGRAADQRQRRAGARRGERAARPADPGRRRHHGQHGRGAGLQRRHLGVGRWRGPGRSGAPAPRSQGRSAAARVAARDVAADLAAALEPAGFEVKRFVLYDAREETALPDSARAALEARALDVVTFFSPRAASVFARMVEDAGLAATPARRHRRRHQPGRAGAGGRPAVQGGRGGRAADAARPCWTRSTDWPKPLYKDRRP